MSLFLCQLHDGFYSFRARVQFEIGNGDKISSFIFQDCLSFVYGKPTDFFVSQFQL